MKQHERDIAELKRQLRQAEAELERLNETKARESHIKQVLLAIRNVNQLIVSETDPLRLIHRACFHLTETMGYYNAWIALIDEDAGSVSAVDESGFSSGFDQMREGLEAGEFPACMRLALENKKPLVIRQPAAECPDCPLSFAYRGRAGMCRSLHCKERNYGILSVSVPAAYAEDPEEIALFDEVASDLAFALHKIEADAERERTREELNILRRIVNNSPAVVF